jgi:NAD(P)-dependent dehydrogenase (short-subunit alcohol dehydrogenase family)
MRMSNQARALMRAVGCLWIVVSTAVVAQPRAVPAQADAGGAVRYEVQPSDVLQVSVWREPELTQQVIVRPDGAFSFPLVGEVNAVGKTVEELSSEEFRQTLETNLFGVFYTCHHAIPLMKKRGGGYIINISSLAGQNAHARMSAYNASKFALNGFSEALMQEVRHDGIKVSYICPGSVNTDFGGDTANEEKAWQLQPADIAETIVDLLSFDRRALPSKIEIRPSAPPKS